MFENGKPDIVLKKVKIFNIKRTHYKFDLKKSLKLGIVVLVMFDKMLVIVFIIHFYSVLELGQVLVLELMSPEM